MQMREKSEMLPMSEIQSGAASAAGEQEPSGARCRPRIGNLVRNKTLAKLHTAFHKDRWVRPEEQAIDIDADGTEVVLRGTTSLAAKRRAAILARMASCGLVVCDQLRRRSPAEIDDGEIGHMLWKYFEQEQIFRQCGLMLRRHGRSEVRREPRSKRQSITIGVDNGIVTVAGRVDSLSHYCMAEALAWRVEGSREVDNELGVSRPAHAADGELNAAVQLCLERDPLIETDQLHVHTAAGIVLLEGIVANSDTRARVLQDVWSVPGVWDVDDFTQEAAV
jgi:osmotically-inducible protein OsmY